MEFGPSTSPMAPPESARAYCRGRLLAHDAGSVPLDDRGFLFGEAVYEAMLTWDRNAFAWEPHLLRLERSAEGIGLPISSFREELGHAVGELLGAAVGPGLLYLQVTGGSAGPRDHLPPRSPVPAVYGVWRPFDFQKVAAQQQRGVAVVTLADPRWPFARWKTTQLLGNVLGKRIAAEQGADECVFIDQDGFVLEAASANVFAVFSGRALTPGTDRNILPGITRELLLEHANDLVVEADLTAERLRRADEIFITSTTRPVIPVVRLDGDRVGSGEPGPVTRELAQRVRGLMQADFNLG